jgi:hypothetical protein
MSDKVLSNGATFDCPAERFRSCLVRRHGTPGDLSRANDARAIRDSTRAGVPRAQRGLCPRASRRQRANFDEFFQAVACVNLRTVMAAPPAAQGGNIAADATAVFQSCIEDRLSI